MTSSRLINSRPFGHEVFVLAPKAGATIARTISEGSGIVASWDEDRTCWVIDYEGNIYGAENLRAYEQRVYQAASRQVTRYPTVARIHLPDAAFRASFEVVGVLDYEGAMQCLRSRRDTGKSDVDCLRGCLELFEVGNQEGRSRIQEVSSRPSLECSNSHGK